MVIRSGASNLPSVSVSGVFGVPVCTRICGCRRMFTASCMPPHCDADDCASVCFVHSCCWPALPVAHSAASPSGGVEIHIEGRLSAPLRLWLRGTDAIKQLGKCVFLDVCYIHGWVKCLQGYALLLVTSFMLVEATCRGSSHVETAALQLRLCHASVKAPPKGLA